MRARHTKALARRNPGRQKNLSTGAVVALTIAGAVVLPLAIVTGVALYGLHKM